MESVKSKDSLNGLYETTLHKTMEYLEVYDQVLCTKVSVKRSEFRTTSNHSAKRNHCALKLLAS